MSETHEHVCTPTVQSDGQPDLYFPNGGADGPDARLIAAAPMLLAALERLRDCYMTSQGPDVRQSCWEQALSAIEQAKGDPR